MRVYKHLDDHIETYLSTILLLLFSVLCIVQVVMRYIFYESLTWSEELSRYAFVWFVYTSAAYGVRYQRHVRFSLIIHLSEQISPSLVGLFKITALFFWMSFLDVLEIYSIKLVMTQCNTVQLSPANHIPMYLIYLGMRLGAFLMTFRVVQQIVFELSEIKSYITKEQS